MKSVISIFFALGFATCAQAATPTFTTSCEIRDGNAYGYVHNSGDSFEIDGTIWFYLFDEDGDLIDKEDDYEYEFVSSRSTEEIDHTRADSRAKSCSFNVDSAIQDHPPQPRYTTRCDLRDGVAFGYVNNLGDAFEIDGTIWFYFYDDDGNQIDDEDDYEYEYVSSRSTEEIDHTRAPSRAARCSFDIRGAIKP